MSFRDRIDAIERWLTPGRMLVAALVVLAGNLLATAVWIATQRHLLDRFGQPVGGDFIIFYAASALTLKGQAMAAFSAKAMLAAERAAVAGTPAGLLWCYPPSFQLLIAPLALMPFAAAYAVWSGLGAAAYLAVVTRVSRHRWTLLFACAFPGLFVTLWQGQTSLFVGAALGAGLMLLDRRPWIAGAVLGLLVCKPQFAILLPLLMLGTGRWRSIGGAAISVMAALAISAAVFGLPLWRMFLTNLPEVSASLTRGELPWAKVPSVFVALAWLGLPHTLAMALHVAIGLAVALATLASWRRPGPLPLKAALAVLATLIITPYSFNYDLVLLALPIAAVAEWGRFNPLPTGTKLSIAFAAFIPNLFLSLAQHAHVQLTPFALLFVFAMVWRAYAATAVAPSARRHLGADTIGAWA
jgi:multidrug transporter EmrE-like cation transporter